MNAGKNAILGYFLQIPEHFGWGRAGTMEWHRSVDY
jgi:hypothetical protein